MAISCHYLPLGNAAAITHHSNSRYSITTLILDNLLPLFSVSALLDMRLRITSQLCSTLVVKASMLFFHLTLHIHIMLESRLGYEAEEAREM